MDTLNRPGHHLDPVALDRAFAIARRQADDGEVPFTILGVADASGILRLEAATAPSQPNPVGTDAVCLLASITKPIVATAVMRLHQDGRFHLGLPLSTWLPELTGDGRETITAWHVLTHTTGIEDTGFDQAVRGEMDRAGALAWMRAAPVTAPVGSRFAYATLTFDLLTEAIERALGEPFEEILHETVLDPLGMVDTVFAPRPDQQRRLAPIVFGAWEEWRRTDPLEVEKTLALRRHVASLRLAGAGLHSTAGDLLRFGRAMLRGGELDGARILSRPFVDLATREVTVDGIGRQVDRYLDNRYAIGWGKPDRTSSASPRAFEHGGATGTRLYVDPEHDLVVVYLTGVWALPFTYHDSVVNAVYAALRD